MVNEHLRLDGTRYRCSICKKDFNGNYATTNFFVLNVVLHAVVVISEVLR